MQVFAVPPAEKDVLDRWTRAGKPPGQAGEADETMLAILKTPAARRTPAQTLRLRAWLDNLAENLALGKRATQSSTMGKCEAARAVDGKVKYAFTHTETSEDPWWQVDLGKEREIDRIVVWNRSAFGYFKLAGFRVRVLDKRRKVVWQSPMIADPPAPRLELSDSDGKDLALSSVSASPTR